MRLHHVFLLSGASLAFCTLAGCVDRMMTIDTDPQGAVVYLNDQEVGRTPLQKDFNLYGNYEVQIRKEGFEPIKTTQQVQEPWWQLIPADLFTEVLPFRFHDQRHFQYSMTPATQQTADPDVMLSRAGELRSMLLSSPTTRVPSTLPVQPVTQPSPRAQ